MTDTYTPPAILHIAFLRIGGIRIWSPDRAQVQRVVDEHGGKVLTYRLQSDGACPKCGGEFKSGVAMTTESTGVGDFGTDDVVTLSQDPEKPKLVAVTKCTSCGASFT